MKPRTGNVAKPLVSVVIPVYNAAAFLGTCLKSVIRAFEFAGVSGEILLINNNSTDSSAEIIQDFCHRYRGNKALALHPLECQTWGASAVRNLGARKAKGKYLWFVDADDEIAENSIKLLTDEAETENADFVMLGVERVYPENAKNTDGKRDYLPALNVKSPDFKHKFTRYGVGPWQLLLNRDWWLKRDFRFKEGIIHEDMELLSSLILYTDRVASLDKPLYFYRQTANSVLHKSGWDPHSLDIFPALEGLYERFGSATPDGQPLKTPDMTPASVTYYPDLEWFFIWNLLLDSARDFAGHKQGKAAREKTRKMLKTYFPNWRRNQFFREKPLKTRLRIRLNYRK